MLGTALLFIVVVWLVIGRSNDRQVVEQLARRVALLEQEHGAVTVAISEPATPAAPPQVATPPAMARSSFEDVGEPAPEFGALEPAGPRERSAIERVIAEHALALVGGLFVLAATVFFVSYAIDQGWIGPWGKFTMALALGVALVAAGLRVASRLDQDERCGRAIGSLHGVLAATGVGVVFIAIVAAVRVQELLTPVAGVVLEVLAAAAAVQLARTWRSQDLAALGIGVGLAAPMLVGVEPTGVTISLLAVTLAAAVVLAVAEAWPRMLLGATIITFPQVAAFMDDATIAAGVTVTAAWWALLLAGCLVGFARAPHGVRSIVSTVFAAALGAATLFSQATAVEESERLLVLFGFAAAQVLLGAALLRRDEETWRIPAAALIGAGAAVAAVALADATGGAARVAGWAAEAVVLTVLWWHLRDRITLVFACALGAAALLHTITLDAPPTLLSTAGDDIVRALVSVTSIVIAALVVRALQARHAGDAERSELHRGMQALAAVGIWYGVAIGIVDSVDVNGGSWSDSQLSLGIWAATGAVLAAQQFAATRYGEAIAAAGIAMLLQLGTLASTDHSTAATLTCLGAALAASLIVVGYRRDSGGALAGFVMVALQAAAVALFAVAHVPPDNLRIWRAEPITDALAQLSMLALAAILVAGTAERFVPLAKDARRWVLGACAVACWYVVSAIVVAAFTTTPGMLEQDAQVALTLTWVVIGAAALFAGTSRRLREHVELRVGGYALLGLAALKLVAADTAQLETPMRVVAFLVTGLGLLGSAALEQRMRDDRDR